MNFKALLTILSPAYWLMNYPLDKQWDKELRELMSCHIFQPLEDDRSCYSVSLGSRKIWVANYPYAAFTIPIQQLRRHYVFLLEDFVHEKVRPRRYTIALARQKLINDMKSWEQ